MMESKQYLFAAGGSWGHIGPAIAVAKELSNLDGQSGITFVAGRSKFERSLSIDFPVKTIVKAPLPRTLSFYTILFPFKLFFALFQSLLLVRKSDVVIGFGGYIATPVYLAAKILNKSVVIHEANALPGFANRLGRKFAVKIFTNFPSLADQWGGSFVGIPLNASISELASSVENGQRNPGRKVLVLGGSQGSSQINKAIWEFLLIAPEDISIVHAVGSANLHLVPDQIAQAHMGSRYLPSGFIEDMASAYQEADLVISRAGAVTCAEIRELGKRAIIVPLPHGNGEQEINGRELAKGAQTILVKDSDFTGRWLSDNLERAFKLDNNSPTQPQLRASKIMAEEIFAQARKSKMGKSL